MKQKPMFTGLFDLSLEIERFLDGRSTGAPLMQALYGAVMDEPIPERLLALVRAAKPETPCAKLRLCNAGAS